MRKRQAGIMIIEMLVVIAIIAILSQIALPAYQNSVLKSKRTAAKGILMDVVSRQEQFFVNNKSYAPDLSALGLADPYYVDKTTNPVISTDSTRVYSISLANTTNTSFDVVATALLSQVKDSCGNYTLKSNGIRQTSGSADASVCW